MEKSKRLTIFFIGVFIFLLLLGSIWMSDSYLLLSFMLIFVAMGPFFIRFEWKKISTGEIVLVAMLAAIAAVSRVPFAAIPSVQPTSFIIIIVALVFGGEFGFLVGTLAAFVSNLFLGQGPWTPWQMLGWGMIGLTAGLLKETWLLKNMKGRLVFGFIWGFLFGWIMNMWFIVGLGDIFNWKSFLGVIVSSFYFDLAHALSNILFLAIFSKSWIKILERFKQKYGLLT